ETGSTAGSGRSGRGSGGSSPPRYRRRRAAPARAPRSLRPALRACGCSSLFLAERFQAGGDLLERLGERLVEFSVRRLGGAAQRIAHALAGGARGVTDVVGGNPHWRPRDRGFGCRCWRSSRSTTLPRAAPWPPPAGRRRRSSFALG